jgi:hypothetical protein
MFLGKSAQRSVYAGRWQGRLVRRGSARQPVPIFAFDKSLVLPALAAFFMFSAVAGEAMRTPEGAETGMRARIAQLRAEIAALDAQARSDSPEFEAELREWEGRMAEPSEWSAQKKGKESVPGKIRKILAIEPSERSLADAVTLARYFRPHSKTVATAERTAAAKRAELVALRRAAR